MHEFNDNILRNDSFGIMGSETDKSAKHGMS